jgi:imidazolonepropionase-like amidohydrolase
MLDPREALGPEEALAAVSAGGGASLGSSPMVLAAGGPATFCIVSGDPFDDASTVVQTWIDGVRAC